MKRIGLLLVLLIMSRGVQAMQPVPQAPARGYSQDVIAQNVCPICKVANLDHAREDNPTFVLLCGHRFCQKCITLWLHQRNVCPLCVRHFECGVHWPLAGRHIDRINMLNNIVMWTPTVSLTACCSAIVFLIIRKLTEGF